jgi:hypothetical protein
VCRITVPSTNAVYSTGEGTIVLGGMTTDDVGVVLVGWTNAATGTSGVASGVSTWLVTDAALAVGENEITVRARDAAGNVGSDTIAITRLSGTNGPPVADAGPGRSVALRGRVSLDGSGSSDPDGDGLTYLWEQISGPVAVLENAGSAGAAFVPSEPGEYVFRLTVSDGALGSSDSVVITVTDEVDTLVVVPNCVAKGLVDTVTVKGPSVLKGKRVTVYTASGALVSGLALDEDLARGGIAFPLDPGLYILVAEADTERFVARLVVMAP